MDSTKGSEQARERLIVALDVSGAEAALELARALEGVCRWVKVGLELYLAGGNAVVERLAGLGFSIFLDLKFHDIPNTVAGAVRSASSLGVSLLTVHTGGGPAMLQAAAEAASAPGAPRLLAVTVLTSMDRGQLGAIGVSDSPEQQVLRLARMAWNAGVRGMVSSAEEVGRLRAEFGPGAELVTPGIRPAGSDVGDQKRIATPAEAIQAGASRLVVGRPITGVADPALAAAGILEDIGRAIFESGASQSAR